nr:hypothetical protein [Tanacetum cinerariifolium]
MVLGYKSGLESVEERLKFLKTNEYVYIEDIKLLKVEIQMEDIAIKELRRKLEVALKEKDGIQLTVEKLENISKSLNKLIDSQIMDNRKKGLGYNAVLPPHIGLFMPHKPDLSYIGLEEFTSEPAVETLNAKTSEKVTKHDSYYHQRQVENQKIVKPVWNYNQRVNQNNFAKNTHPCPKRNIVPKAIYMKSGIKSINAAWKFFSKETVTVNTARPVNTAQSKTAMNAAKPWSYFSNSAHLVVKRPIQSKTTFKNSFINQRVNAVRNKHVNTARRKAVVNTARPKALLNAVKGNEVYAVKASVCWVWKPKTKVIDHGSKKQ